MYLLIKLSFRLEIARIFGAIGTEKSHLFRLGSLFITDEISRLHPDKTIGIPLEMTAKGIVWAA